MPSFIMERTIHVPHEKVWQAAASDFSKSPGPSITVVPLKAGDPQKNGAGAERTITFNNVRSLPFLKPQAAYERIEAVDPPNSFTYSIYSGPPIAYLGVAQFQPKGDTTVITWNVNFTPKLPGITKLVEKSIRQSVDSYIDELEKIQ